jgi:hypothetical protein
MFPAFRSEKAPMRAPDTSAERPAPAEVLPRQAEGRTGLLRRARRTLSQWLGRRPAVAETTTRSSRIEVRPPAAWGQADSVWNSLWEWLRHSDESAQRPARTLEAARLDFCLALGDLTTRDAADLLRRGEHARSLRELWHLRAELYSIVARHRNQPEADRRLAQLNRHFPTGTSLATPSNASARQKHDHIA